MIDLVNELGVREAKSVEDFREGRILLMNKPLTWSSFDVVNKVRIMLRAHLSIKKIKVGHAGTLDPLATGLLVLCIGKATKRIEEFMGQDKEYIAGITFGGTTPSFDLETEIVGGYPTEHITQELLKERLSTFVGTQMQRPPVFSAVRVDGRRSYENARKGNEDIEIAKREISIHELELLSYKDTTAMVRVVCSKGTYIRSLANDLGKAIDSGAHLSSLQRTANGNLRVEDALSIEDFKEILVELENNSDESKGELTV